MVGQLQKLPTVETVGALESVAHFDGAMPTGVTVSHQGRIFVSAIAGGRVLNPKTARS